MAKIRAGYICQACGARHSRWMGQCPACGQWNSLEEVVQIPGGRQPQRSGGTSLTVRTLADIEMEDVPRLRTGLAEWDRVVGGGIVPGSIVLVGGDPGVGKSTLLMQIAEAVVAGSGNPRSSASSHRPISVLYVSGEESLPQIGIRARRLGLGPHGVSFGAETDLQAIVERVAKDPPALLVVDSIQSVYDSDIESVPGSLTQLRECTLRLCQVAKERHVAVILVGHVTKEGLIAGPKVLEHMVDVVLYFQGEGVHAYRLLRSVKNRFGPTNEVGVFEMRDGGLVEVPNPSAAFLADRVQSGSGSAIVVTLEGTRPMLVEVQALVTRSTFAMPRRMTSGLDFNRVALLAAVVAKRAGAPLHDFDIHVNVVGGLRVEETAADLGTALAMLSSYRDVPLDPETVIIGEVGLSGELRGVGQTDLRVGEAAKFGFRRALVPRRANGSAALSPGIELVQASTLREAAALAGVQ